MNEKQKFASVHQQKYPTQYYNTTILKIPPTYYILLQYQSVRTSEQDSYIEKVDNQTTGQKNIYSRQKNLTTRQPDKYFTRKYLLQPNQPKSFVANLFQPLKKFGTGRTKSLKRGEVKSSSSDVSKYLNI